MLVRIIFFLKYIFIIYIYIYLFNRIFILISNFLFYIFCTGYNDQVRCFHCDGGLRGWEPTDDVWFEHARWFSKCGYVILVRGQKFIQHCIENRPPLDPAVLIIYFFNILSDFVDEIKSM